MFIHFHSLDRVRQIGGWLRKHSGIARQTALNIASEMHGYEGWEHLLIRWKEVNATASTVLEIRTQQFRAVMADRRVSDPDAILEMIDPPRSDENEIPTISISMDDIARQAAKYDPRVKAAESRLEFFHQFGDPTKLIDAATKVLQATGRHQSARFFELIHLNQNGNPEAALFATNLYLGGYMDDPDGNIVLGLLERALESNFPDVRDNANYGLGVHLRDTDPVRARRHMQNAVDANLDVAKFAMALYLDSGIHGYEKDPEQAMSYYVDCHENHGHRLAKLEIAKALVLRGRSDLPYDGEHLLAELARDGQKDAAFILRWMNARRRLESMDIRLPNKVTPTGGNRPKMVRDALLDKFGIAEKIAEEVTASLYGYGSWYALMKAATDKKSPKGTEDEDCTADELVQRKKSQANLLVEYLGLEQSSAEVGMELLQPTGRTISKPSLKNLENAKNHQALKHWLGDEYDGIRDMVSKFTQGEPENLMAFVYGAFPVRAEEPDLLDELDKAYVSGNHDETDLAFGNIVREEPEKLPSTVAVSGKFVKTSPWALVHQAFVWMNMTPSYPVEAKRLLLAQLAQFETSVARPFALTMLGEIESSGGGGKRDANKALAYFREAAALGQAQAAFGAALILSERGTARGTNDAIHMYRTAIELGFEKARFNLARQLIIRGRISDYGEAWHLMRVAADRGDHLAVEFMARNGGR